MFAQLPLLIRRSFVVGVLMVGVLSMIRWISLSQGTTMKFRIVNSYSGSLQLVNQTWVWLYDTMLGRRWTNQHQLHLGIAADQDSTYILSWSFDWIYILWSGTGQYSEEYIIDLSTWDTEHRFELDFMSNWEPLSPSDIVVMVDDLAPPRPILWLENNTIISWDVIFQWSWVSDSGIGLSQYVVFFGMTPLLSSMVAFVSTGTSLLIPWSQIPWWTIYWAVIAVDQLGNQSDYVIWYVHHQLPTVIYPSVWWLWGSVSNPRPITIDTDSLPVYQPIWDGSYIEHIIKCPWRRISALKRCIERDRFLVARQSNSVNYSPKQVRDDLPLWLIWVGKLAYVWDIANGDMSLATSALDRVRSTSTWVSDSLDALLLQLMSSRYEADMPLWRVLPNIHSDLWGTHDSAWPSLWWLNLCEWVNYCVEPDHVIYEQIIWQYGEDVVSRTRVFSWYAVLLILGLVMTSMWFFILGYHHHYIIKYLK